MTNNICWYCGKNQATASKDYPKPYVSVTYRPHHTFETLKPITHQVPRCIECARVHLKTEGNKEFNKLFIPVLLSGILLVAINSFVALDLLDAGTFIPVLVIVAILSFVGRRLYNNRIRAKSGTKKFYSKDSEYLALLAEDQKEQYYMNPHVDLDDLLTFVQRKSYIGLKEIHHAAPQKDTTPPAYDYANSGGVLRSVSTGTVMGGINEMQVPNAIMDAVYNDPEILEVYARAESLQNAVQMLKNGTAENWSYDGYLKYITAMPEFVREDLPLFSEVEWNAFPKEKRYDFHNIFLKGTQESLESTLHTVQEMIKEKMEKLL